MSVAQSFSGSSNVLKFKWNRYLADLKSSDVIILEVLCGDKFDVYLSKRSLLTFVVWPILQALLLQRVLRRVPFKVRDSFVNPCKKTRSAFTDSHYAKIHYATVKITLDSSRLLNMLYSCIFVKPKVYVYKYA